MPSRTVTRRSLMRLLLHLRVRTVALPRKDQSRPRTSLGALGAPSERLGTPLNRTYSAPDALRATGPHRRLPLAIHCAFRENQRAFRTLYYDVWTCQRRLTNRRGRSLPPMLCRRTVLPSAYTVLPSA